jgi:membrane protease YdiL (CAAX protease family)
MLSHPDFSRRDRIGFVLRDNRLFILIELLLIVLLVSLNLQLTTLLLLLLGWLSLWLRRQGWRDLGLKRPSNWAKTILIGTGVAIIMQLFSIFILVPFLYRVTNTALDLSQFEALRGNVGLLAVSLVVAWTLAGFGEEMVYRGYILNRFADFSGHKQWGWGVGILLSTAFFGLAHLYQGVTGVWETAVSGLIFAILYMASGRNLWLPIITHGMVDTIGFLLIFAGLYP